MDGQKDTAVEAVLEHLIEHGPGDIATVFARAFELAMQIERERFLGAGLYERTAERRGYATFSYPQVPAASFPAAKPATRSARREKPRHMTVVPGGASCRRAR